MKVLLVAAWALVALTGCSQLLSIHNTDHAFWSRVTAVDAKQRMIFTVVGKDYRRYCSEPPPDVLTALSVGTSGDLGLSGLKSKDPELKLRAALAMSETAATIERTQTINVLREAMFRTCERFLSGAISADEFIVQAARDQRAMIAILAIEQLTRALRSPSTVVSAGAANATYSDPTELLAALKRAQEDEGAAQKAKAAADKAVQAEDANGVPCADAKPDAADAAKQKHFDTCASLLKAQESAGASLEQARGNLALFRNIAERQATGFAAGAGLSASFAAGGGQSQLPSDAALREVAATVGAIVNRTFAFEEIRMTCVVRLRNMKANSTLTQLDEACIELVKQEAATEQQKLRAEEAALEQQVGRELDRFRTEREIQEDRLRDYLGAAADARKAWRDLLGKSGVQLPGQHPVHLASSPDEMVKAFLELGGSLRRQIVQAIGGQS